MDATRRFVLLDAILLIAALAAAMAINRIAPPDWSWTSGAINPGNRAYIAIESLLQGVVPYLFTITLAVLASRLIPPRPEWERLRGQPGFVACATIGACSSALALKIAVFCAAFPPNLRAPPSDVIATLVDRCGFVITGAWLASALMGRWDADRSWPDRAGRVLGISWFVAAVLAQLSPFLFLW